MNECITQDPTVIHNCHQNATCTNTHGSFTCKCIDVYQGDGVNCEGEHVNMYRGCHLSPQIYLLPTPSTNASTLIGLELMGGGRIYYANESFTLYFVTLV